MLFDPAVFLPAISLGTFAPLLLWPFYGMLLILAMGSTALSFLVLP